MGFYQKWVELLFGHSETNEHLCWDFQTEHSENKDNDSIAFFVLLTNDLPELLKKYSVSQISSGLEHLFNDNKSSFVDCLRDGSAPIECRIRAIQGIKKIYEHVFEPMCEPKLGHLDEGDSKLNELCYMFWDFTPLIYCEGNLYEKELYSSLADVMKASLKSSNIACIESGLHGLGHMVHNYPECEGIAQDFILNSKCSDERVLSYAAAAKIGRIQ